MLKSALYNTQQIIVPLVHVWHRPPGAMYESIHLYSVGHPENGTLFSLSLSLLECLRGPHLTKEEKIKPAFERLLISWHHLLDWFSIVKSESFSMDFACEKLLLSL